MGNDADLLRELEEKLQFMEKKASDYARLYYHSFLNQYPELKENGGEDVLQTQFMVAESALKEAELNPEPFIRAPTLTPRIREWLLFERQILDCRLGIQPTEATN